ncbi:MAG TPA: serpin family protein [bacterium]|nr:serpin family protein [bacterium]
MKRFLVLTVLFGMLGLFVSCGGDDQKEDPATTVKYQAADEHAAAVSPAVVAANNDFAARIFEVMATAEQGKNLMISPLSIELALAMTMNGASGDNLTEMQTVLGFDDLTLAAIDAQFLHLIKSLESADKDMVLAIANSIWMDDLFEPRVKTAFKEALLASFEAEPYTVDMADTATVDLINQWVSDNTNGKIEKIIDDINDDTVMFLINALYFKAAWTVTFDEDRTYDGQFELTDGTQKTVKMMTFKEAQEFKFFSSGYGAAGGYSAVRLPYGRDKFAFYGFIPNDGTVDDFIGRMADEGLDGFFTNLVATEEVPVLLPRFKFAYEKSLNEILQALGMEQLFAPGGLLNMADQGEGLYVSEVKHKTYIEVNEQGTEAAAVTSVEVGETSVPEGFYATKPFVFVIRDDRSGTILFMGKVEDPSQE